MLETEESLEEKIEQEKKGERKRIKINMFISVASGAKFKQNYYFFNEVIHKILNRVKRK